MQPTARVQAAKATSVRCFTGLSCVLARQRTEARRVAQCSTPLRRPRNLDRNCSLPRLIEGAVMVDTVIVEAETPAVSAVSWPAIIAGGFVAAAFTLLLLALGAGIGFSVISPWSGAPDVTTTKAALVGGIYMAVTAVMASALGGYVTGRLRVRWTRAPLDEVYFRDTAHGVLAWAFATVMGAALLASAATIVGSGAAANPGPTANNSTNDITAPFLDRLFRPDYAALTGGTGQQAAGVFAGGRDLAADREAARRILPSWR